MTPRSFRLWLLTGLAGSTICASAQTPVQPMPPPPGAPQPTSLAAEEYIDGIKLNDAPIDLVLSRIEDWSGRTILRPQQLPTPNITINLSRRVPKSEAMLALETLLNLNGIGLVPVGDKFLKVVDLGRVRTEAPLLIEGSTLNMPPSGQVASKLFQLEFQRATEFIPQLNMLLNGLMGGYTVFDKSNAVLITDSISNLQRIETLVTKLDKPVTAGMTPKFYSLSFAKASDLVNKINSILQGPLQSQLGSATKYTADDRTNQVVVIADQRQYPFFDDLIAKLDVKADPNTRNEVLPLKHAASKDVATLLTNLISGQSKATQGQTQSQSQSQRNALQQRNQNGNVPPGAPPMPVSPEINVNPNIGNLGDMVGSQEFSSLVNIQADERSNSVVISGTVDDIRLIKELVQKIDVILAQVRIEVVIAEVSLDHANETGISALGLKVEGDKLVGFSGSAIGAAVGGDGTTFASITRGEGVQGARDLAGVVGISANSAKSNITILANPTLVTTHNKEATLFVGESRPSFGQVQTIDSTTTTTGASALRSSITYQEAGIQLKIKPLIGIDGTVQLDIEQTFNAFGNNVSLGSDLSQAAINKREAKSFLNVADREIVVLGGYQSTSRNKSRSRLGPIPIIGDLLGSRSWRTTRTELLVFIRPHVIPGVENTSADATQLMNRSSDPETIHKALDGGVSEPEDKNKKDASDAPVKRRR